MKQHTGDYLAHRGKERIERDLRLTKQRAERLFFCRGCGKEEHGRNVPESWYSLSRHGNPLTSRPILRLGLYCSLDCLTAELPRLTGIAKALGMDWSGATSPYVQDRTQPVEE